MSNWQQRMDSVTTASNRHSGIGILGSNSNSRSRSIPRFFLNNNYSVHPNNDIHKKQHSFFACTSFSTNSSSKTGTTGTTTTIGNTSNTGRTITKTKKKKKPTKNNTNNTVFNTTKEGGICGAKKEVPLAHFPSAYHQLPPHHQHLLTVATSPAVITSSSSPPLLQIWPPTPTATPSLSLASRSTCYRPQGAATTPSTTVAAAAPQHQHSPRSMGTGLLELDHNTVKQLYKEHRGVLSSNDQYYYALSRGQLKAASRTSALLSGFAMIALVELIYQKSTPHWLFLTLAVVTTLLVSVHLLTLLMSTCLLPYIEAHGRTKDSPHSKLKFYVQMSWLFSTCIGLLLVLVEIAIIFFVKFDAIDYGKGAWITTSILVPVLALFMLVSYRIHRIVLRHFKKQMQQTVEEGINSNCCCCALCWQQQQQQMAAFSRDLLLMKTMGNNIRGIMGTTNDRVLENGGIGTLRNHLH